MAQFEAFNKDVEVNRQTVLSVVNSMERGRDLRMEILNKHGIYPYEKQWFKQQLWLNAFRDISENLGEMSIYLIGKAIIDTVEFPPIKDLYEGLKLVNVAYHMNHRLNGKAMFNPENGELEAGIGFYKLIHFDPERREAAMLCENPYPSKFDEGLIAQIVNQYKPTRGTLCSVKLDPSKESRKTGAHNCTFLISW